MKNLLIIDVQNGFINENNKQMLENIKNLLKNERFNNIIATQFINDENSQHIKSLNWNAMFTSPDIDFAFDLPKNAIIVRKSSYGLPNGCFQDDGLHVGNLVIAKDSEIYLCGTDYDACVLAIAYQLFDNGFRPKIIRSCIGSSAKVPVEKEKVERIMTRNFGKNAVADEVK